MKQKKNYWTYCKNCDTYHTLEEVPCFIDPSIPQLPALSKNERGPPLWTPDMKGTSMELVLAMHLEIQKRKRKVDDCIDWGIMNTISPGNLEEWV